MARRHFSFFCFVLTIVFAAISVHAQTAATGAITGRVADPSGAMVPNVAVSASNVDTGVQVKTTTTGAGAYTFPNLQTGIYDVRAEAPGFSRADVKAVRIEVGARRDVNFTLQLAGATTTVEVSAQAPLIESTKTEVSTVVTEADMAVLPVTSSQGGAGGSGINDFASLATTAPGVRIDLTGNNLDLVGPGAYNDRGNLINIDGGNISDQVVSTRDGVGASVDEIKEFQVLTNNYNAEYGQAGGLILNAVTKSGGNQIHGDYHGFFRGRNLSASSYWYNLGLANPGQHQSGKLDGRGRAPFFKHENGFTLGGPFVKDKTFWFVSYEKLLQGSPLTLKPPGGSTLTVTQPDDELLWSAKVDHHFNVKHTASVRFNVQRLRQDNQIVQISTTTTPNSLVASVIHDHTLNMALTSVLTPHLVNEARVFWHRFFSLTPTKSTLPGSQGPDFYFGAAFCCPQGANQNRYQGIENITYTHGEHTFKAGANISYYPYFSLFQQVHFGLYKGFGSFANFGPPTGPTGANPPKTFGFAAGPGAVNAKDNVYGFYGQDSWKIRPNITVNYGLRWDYEAGAFKGGYGHANVPGGCLQANGLIPACSSDLNNFQPRLGIAWSPQFENGLLAWLMPKNKSLITASGAEVTELAYLNISLDSLNFDGVTLLSGTVAPSAKAGCSAATLFANYPNAPSQAQITNCSPPGAGFGRVRPISNHLRNPEVRHANVSFQRELPGDMVFNVQYVGAFGFGQFGETDTNTPPVIADPAHPGFFYYGARPNPAFGPVRTQQNTRSSSYNGLIVDVHRQLSHHFQFAGSYTWSHTIASTEDFYGVSEPADPTNIRAERSEAQLDVRHLANLRFVVDSNKLFGGNRLLRGVVNDWQIGSGITMQAGRPYPISSGDIPFADSTFFGIGNETFQRPDVLPDGTISTAGIAGAFGTNYLVSANGVAACVAAQGAANCPTAPNTFVAPGAASSKGAADIFSGDIVDFRKVSGNVARNAGRTDGLYRVDMSITRAFKPLPSHEKLSVELRADFFNVLNHFNFGGFNGSDTVDSFGIGSSAKCTFCINPVTGSYVGSNGQILHLNDLKHGRISKDLTNPVFALGDPTPSLADLAREIQLVIRVRF